MRHTAQAVKAAEIHGACNVARTFLVGNFVLLLWCWSSPNPDLIVTSSAEHPHILSTPSRCLTLLNPAPLPWLPFYH